MESRAEERKEQRGSYGGRDDDRRDSKISPGDDDKQQGYDKDGFKNGKPDARGPSRKDAPSQKARGKDERDDSKDSGKPEGSSKRDTDKQDDQGSKGRSPNGKDDDDDRDHRAPWVR